MKRYDNCIDCKEYLHIQGKSRCKSCYNKWYRNKPGVKKSHRERMIRYRLAKPEMYNAIEKKRANTKKRQEYRLEYSKEYYKKNAEYLKEYQSQWRKDNPIQRDEYKRKRRARVKNLPDTLTLQEWGKILLQYNYSCRYCGTMDDKLVKEHWIPASKGGGYTKDNIVPSCQICNSKKGTMTGEEFIKYLKVQ